MPAVEPSPRQTHLKKILVRGVNWLGDAVMTTPALHRLRQHLPESQITLLTPQQLAELWAHHPSIDSFVAFQQAESLWSVARRIRAEAFDVALVLPNSPRSALEVWLAGIPHRIGYARAWRSWLLTQAVAGRAEGGQTRKRSVREIRTLIAEPVPPRISTQGQTLPGSAHQVHEYLHLASVLGASPAPLAPELEVTTKEVQAARSKFVDNLLAARKLADEKSAPIWLGLNPSAAYGPAKCWPAERFAAVAREISQRIKGSFWLVLGGQADWEVCQHVTQMSGSKVANLAGKTSLRELMAVLKICRVLLTNDSGPMHVAAALGTPVVVPFGSTSPQLTGPGLPRDPRHHLLQAGVACSPCFRRWCPIDFRCMTGITVELVVAAVLEAASGWQAAEVT